MADVDPAPALRSLIPRDGGTPAADSVYAVIREAILTGTLQAGARLAEENLAAQLDVSRTPVREALLRLEAERLAERASRRGLVVASVAPEEILEVYRVRQTIDGLAAALAAESAGPADIAKLRGLNDRFRLAVVERDSARLSATNLEFHEALARAGRNGLLLYFMQQIHDRVRRFPGTTFTTPGRAEAAVDEHEAIIRAIEMRSAAEAEQAARLHMEQALHTRIAMLEAFEEATRRPRRG